MIKGHQALEQIMCRAGIFDGRSILATKHRTDIGELGWLVMTWPDAGDPIDSFWFQGGKFYEITFTDWLTRGINMGVVASEMDSSVYKIILNAIAKWEAETAESARV